MIKKILILFSILVISLGAFLFWTFSGHKTLITPFPYSFTPNAQLTTEKELALAENAKILIIGDQMGEVLSKYTPDLIDDLAKSFKNPPKIYNWSKLLIPFFQF